MLEVRSLSVSYGQHRALEDVSIRVDKGEIVGLLGPNGAGKTTSFRMVVGMITPDKGKVVLAGRDVTKMPMYRRARLGIGYLPQEMSIFRGLNVDLGIDNVFGGQVLGQALGLNTTMPLFAFIGVAVTSASAVIFGEPIWDPVQLLSRIDNPAVVLAALLAWLVLKTGVVRLGRAGGRDEAAP